MFNGPYMILDVQHHITPGNFQTTFTGVRQGIYDLPSIDNFLQSINQNLLTNLQAILKIKKDTPTITPITNTQKGSQVVQKANNTPDTPNSCVSNVDTNAYPNYENIKPTLTPLTELEFATILKKLLPGKESLQAIIYSISYITSYENNSNNNGSFKGYNSNFGGISLYLNWSETKQYFEKSYACVNIKTSNSTAGKSEPLVKFKSVEEYIKFMAARLEANVPRILKDGLPQYYVCNWPKEDVSVDYYQSHKDDFTTVRQTISKALDSCVKVEIIKPETGKQLKEQIKAQQDKLKQPGVTQTPTLKAPLAGNTCPPPLVTSFSPTTGNMGTLVQINGRNLAIVTDIVLVNPTNEQQDLETILAKDITYLNDETLRFPLPQIGTGKVLTNCKILAKSPYGNGSIETIFKYDPAYVASAASSPGGYAGNNQSNTTAPNANNTNTNPQNTGPVTLLSKSETLAGGKITNKLTVSVNPDAGVWVLDKSVEMNISVFDVITSNNNTTQRLNVQVTMKKSDFVNNNTFTITRDDITTILTTSEPFKTTPIKSTQIVTIQFNVLANAGDKVKHPQPTVQSFNFNYSDGTSTTPTPVKNTFAEQPLSITFVGESAFIQGDGPQYFNVKKQSGGYITYKFNAPKFEDSNLVSKIVIGSDGLPVSATYSLGSDTKYTYVWIINSVGKFNFVVEYLPYGYTSPNGGEVLKQTVVSPPFTL